MLRICNRRLHALFLPSHVSWCFYMFLHWNVHQWYNLCVTSIYHRLIFRRMVATILWIQNCSFDMCDSSVVFCSREQREISMLKFSLISLTKESKILYKILSFQQVHNLLKHEMLPFLFKGLSYIAPTCFGPHGPSTGSTYQNLTKVTVSLKLSV
jgi:hypothetical protein